MHEFSIAISMLDIVREQLGRTAPLLSATATLGPLAGINAESLQFCFTEAARQEGFGSPTLTINEVPARMHCLDCDRDYEGRDMMEGCPACGSIHRRVDSGQEFTLDSVEIAGDNDDPTD